MSCTRELSDTVSLQRRKVLSSLAGAVQESSGHRHTAWVGQPGAPSKGGTGSGGGGPT